MPKNVIFEGNVTDVTGYISTKISVFGGTADIQLQGRFSKWVTNGSKKQL
jgi:hypothetical protein